MSRIKSIRSQSDLEQALIRIDRLMGSTPDSKNYDELQVLVDLVELYESKNVVIDLPSPLAAIEFRMDQAGLKPRDLIPILGSKTAVSEVLSGKRPLTMGMARALHEKLGIPAALLLKESTREITSLVDEWAKFPLKAMKKLGWIKDSTRESFAEFSQRSGCLVYGEVPALYRKTETSRANTKSDVYALCAWRMQVMCEANKRNLEVMYQPGSVDEGFLKEVASLSVHSDGPKQAVAALAKKGIALILLPHLPRTHLDGAAFMSGGHAVVGMTLRFDRIDYFWFCLLHELAHVGRHLDSAPSESFMDDHSLRGTSKDLREHEADEWAEKALIPQAFWDASAAKRDPCPESVVNLAMEIRRHPAIIAGRIRYENKNYRLLSQFVGGREIRKQFWIGANNAF